MASLAHTQAIPANNFHAGNTCPHCQENVAIGQLIVTCTACGAIHHDTCWAHKGGCSSYHCDRSVRANMANANPDIIIQSHELENVQVPVLRPRRSPQEAVKAFLPQPPIGISKLAFVSVGFAVASFVGAVGAFNGSEPLMALGIALCLCAMVSGVISLVIISNAENRRSGLPFAATGVGVPVVLTAILFICMSSIQQHRATQHKADLKLQENLPSEESLDRMPPSRANAMRANVAIRTGNGLMDDMRYGSGIVVHVFNHQAYVLTNKHVIGESGDQKITTLFYNGEESIAKVAWMGPADIDLAIIKCQALSQDKWKSLAISGTLLTSGDKVFAIGNPMGLAWSYTEGMISGIRTSDLGGKSMDLYQTQTPINSGNSGGGLYSMDGVLVGVNTWTEDKSVAEGINFSIATIGLLKLLTKEQRETLLGIHEEKEL